MLNKTLQFIEKENLFQNHHKLLLGVSGGIDSMVMLDILYKLKFDISIAHVNFHLRDEDSNLDQELVNSVALKYNVPIFIKDFDTKNFIKENKLSLQESARMLRYNWFSELCNDKKFDYILTAHHLNDQLETILINFVRGTGIKGLRGILPKHNNIVRPLLFASSEEIRNYAIENKIVWRDDITNKSDKYLRNYIRHNIVGKLIEIQPELLKITEQTSNNLRETETLLNVYFDKIRENAFEFINDDIYIKKEYLNKLNPLHIHLFHLLSPYNFNNDNINNIEKFISKDSIPGANFFSNTHKLNIDREFIIISALNQEIGKNETTIFNSINDLSEQKTFDNIEFRIIDKNDINNIKDKNYAFFDANSIEFPIKIRSWQQGDYFYPFGMSSKKKLSDFFIDNKFSELQKERIKILTFNENISWIVGYRTDNRYKVSEKTQKVLQCKLIKSEN